VHFTGHVEDVAEAYASGDIFFFPSFVENEGIAILEAAASGKPLLLRDAECFEGRFTHGVNCLKGATADEFADMINELATDDTLSERLSAGALAVAQAHSLEVVGSRLREIYSELVN
jgi:glycosyltransferase involved in cell wall biosynthesis